MAVLGAGPAGLALAASCADAGLAVAVVAPDPTAPWTATYGAWVDELRALDLDHTLGHVWERVLAYGDERIELGRAYALFDNGRLHQHLLARARPIGVASRPTGCMHRGRRAHLRLEDGRTVVARLVIDAAGSGGALLVRPASPTRTALQSAYGLLLHDVEPLSAPDACVLMDWRPVPGTGRRDPTFLYAMDLGESSAGGRRWFVEETSLARRPELGSTELRRRLAARVGVDLTDRAVHIEHVAIPMGGPLPRRDQPVVGFGAAAGFVHPATGYSVAASLRAAPRVAASIAAGIADGLAAGPLAAQVWRAVWPDEHVRVRALHEFGLDAVLRMDRSGVQSFFAAFFDLPVELWAPYLRIDTTVATVTSVMREVFRRVPWSVRARLVAGSPRPLVPLWSHG